ERLRDPRKPALSTVSAVFGPVAHRHRMLRNVDCPAFGFPGPLRMRRAIVATPDKVAFITGANKGIGLETARGLGELGIAVILGSRDEGNGRKAAESLMARGIKNVEPFQFDATRVEDHDAIVRHLEDRYGKLDILINNAGVMLEEADFG